MSLHIFARPIRRATAARTTYSYEPAGPSLLLSRLRGFRHQLKGNSLEILALIEWKDLHTITDERRLDEAIRARLAMPENARHLVDRYDANDRVGDPPSDPKGAGLAPLWGPPR